MRHGARYLPPHPKHLAPTTLLFSQLVFELTSTLIPSTSPLPPSSPLSGFLRMVDLRNGVI